MTPIKKFTTTDGLSLAYSEEGEGVPLLCLAGLSRNMADFDYIVRDYSDRARILRLDSRGRGASDNDPDFANYSLLRESQDVAELLDHLSLDKVAILGTSRGGILAMILAASHKHRLSAVCLNDVGPVIDPAGLKFIGTYLGKKPEFATYEEGVDVLIERTRDTFPTVTREQWREHAERLWRKTPGGLELRYDPRLADAYAEQSKAATGPDFWPLFDALEGLPVGLLRAENSDIISAATAGEMRKRRPDMLFAEVKDRGHVPFLDEPECRTLLSAFLGMIS